MRHFLILCFAFLSFSSISQEVGITHIANEGVLIKSGNQSLMIDAPFDDFYPQFDVPTEEMVKQMTSKSGEFAGLQAILTTHVHRDHFKASMFGNILRANRRVKMFGPQQANDSLKAQFEAFAAIKKQLELPDYESKIQSYKAGKFSIKAFKLSHNNANFANIQNLGYLIEIDGKTILHVGDAAAVPADFEAIGISDQEIDVAVFPFWFFVSEEGINLIKNVIKPKNAIISHIPKGAPNDQVEGLKESYPGLIIFRKIMEDSLTLNE